MRKTPSSSSAGRTRCVEVPGRGVRAFEVLVLQVVDRAAVFAVDDRHAAALGQNIHRLDELIVVRVPALLEVGQEELERAHTQLHHARDFRHLPGRFEHSAVQAKVQPGARRRIVEHLFHFLQQAVAGASIGKMQQRSRPAISRDARTGFDVIQVDRVHMHINDAREDVFAGGVHDLAGALTRQVRPNGCDRPAAHAHVGPAHP